MKIKFEATIRRPAGTPGTTPWYARKVAAPLWAVLAALAAVLALTALAIVLLPPTSRQANTGPQAPPAAVFLKTDAATQGNWKGVYGSTGFALANDAKNLPPFARIVLPGTGHTATWIDRINQPRALQKLNPPNRIAAAWFGFSPFNIDVNLTGDKMHRVAVYLLDWDSIARAETIEVVDAMNQKALDIRQVSKFTDGQYLVWNMSGHLIIRVTPVAGANAVVSGVFFD